MPKLPGLPTVDPRKIAANVPALPAAHDVTSLLAQIRDEIAQLVPSGQQEDYQDYVDLPISTAAGNAAIRPSGQFGWLYIPDSPRTLTIWSGEGRARLLGTVAAGSSANYQVPKGQAILIEWPSGATDDTLSYWVSSRPIVAQAFNPAFLTAGASSFVAAEDSAFANGDFGVPAWGVVNEADTLNAAASSVYSSLSVNRAGALQATILRNANPVSTDALSNAVFGMMTNARNNGFPAFAPILFNGATWDRQRNNIGGTLLASAARTATTTSADFLTYNARGLVVFLDVTAASGTGGLTVVAQLKDTVSGNYFSLPGYVFGTATGRGVSFVIPGVVASTGADVKQSLSYGLSQTMRVQITHGDATSYTYSVGYGLIV